MGEIIERSDEKCDVIETSMRKKAVHEPMNLSPPTLTSVWIRSTMVDTQLGTQPTPFVCYQETNRHNRPIIQFNQTHLPNYSSKFMPSLFLLFSFQYCHSPPNYASLFRSITNTASSSQLQLSTTLSSYLLFHSFSHSF